VTPAEFQARRDSLIGTLPHDILLVRTSELLADDLAPNRVPDPNFYYLTGLPNALGAVLVLDGPARRSLLFRPTRFERLAGYLVSQGITLGDSAASVNAFPDARPLDDLVPYLQRRFGEDSSLGLLLPPPNFDDRARLAVLPPAGLGSPDAPHPWLGALRELLPGRRIAFDTTRLDAMRMDKSDAEVAALRRVGAVSAAAVKAGIAAIRPGRRQREVEAAVVAACFSGASGVSFWPWAMSGPNDVYPAPWRGSADVDNADRVMQGGELVRLDIGCAAGNYMGDVGRTIPVSGRFTPDQRETWQLMVRAYRAGLAVIRDGTPVADVLAASFHEVERLRDGLKSPLARQAATAILDHTGSRAWQLHGIGLEAAEPPPTVLRSSMVIDYEPILAVAGLGFYLEDMILVTPEGAEILTPGLPTTADEIESFMTRPPRP
jgi:Xaa-Pro aminopeptidase